MKLLICGASRLTGYPEKTRVLLMDGDAQESGVRWSLALLFLLVALSSCLLGQRVQGIVPAGNRRFRRAGYPKAKALRWMDALAKTGKALKTGLP